LIPVFVGSINAHTRKYLINEIAAFNGRRVVVGCSGNFTFEGLLGRYGKPAAVHANDVSLYSCALGWWLTGQPVAIEARDAFDWLRPFCETDEDRAAAVLAASGMLRWLSGKPNAHKERMLRGYQEQFGPLHAVTKAKMQAVAEGMAITEFFAGDVVDHFRRFAGDEGAVFVTFAPTYAGGYERLFDAYDAMFTWDPPDYGLLDDDARDSLLTWLSARDFVWIDDRELDQPLVFAAHVGRMRTQYIYSNAIGDPGQTRRAHRMRDPGFELVEEICDESELAILPISGEVFAFYQEAYLSKGIEPAPPQWALLVLVDGRVAGALGFSQERFGGGADQVYMLSDFAVWPTPYRRLSKLVLMAALSREVQDYLERARELPTRRLVTTAFTDRPVSMKYRGVLDLVKRGEGFLQYAGEFTGASLGDVMKDWRRRYGTSLQS
jgi:hypothetical protein